MHNHYRVIEDPTYGYKRIDPLPSESELSRFYQSRYYDLIRRGGRAPELRRFMEGGEKAEKERLWIQSTLYRDILFLLKQYASGQRVLDVGCGTGELVGFLAANGFEAAGIEPAATAVKEALSRGLKVEEATLEEFAARYPGSNLPRFDAVCLINVLEHVPHPAQAIADVRQILAPDGIMCIRVPNDFNALQLSAQKKLGCPAWWIAIPDHINYFDTASLKNLINALHFEAVYCQCDFPMELFLLMGENYLGDAKAGSICHQKRVNFELSIGEELRRSIFQALAGIGLGRNILLGARKREQP